MKTLGLSIYFLFLFAEVFSQNHKQDSLISTIAISETETVDSKFDSLLLFAQQFIGVKYKYKGVCATGFDCSGYVQFVYDKFDKKLPHASASQANIGKVIQLNDLQKGDLVFFKGRNLQANNVGHVGIVMEAKEGHFKMIHASVHKGVTIDYYPEGEYYRKRYLSARRITFD